MIDLRSGTRDPVIALPEQATRLRRMPGVTGESAALAIGIHALDEVARATELAVWARSAGVPIIGVGLGAERALIGPLTLAERVGCAHCARLRIEAAAAMRVDPPASAGVTSRDLAEIVGEVTTVEAAAALAAGRAGSRIVDHVLHVDGVEVTRHRVIPLPVCAVCGGAATLDGPPDPLGLPDEDDSPLAGWVDALTGVIPALIVDPPACDPLSSPVVVTAVPPHVIDADGSMRRMPSGWGKGLTAADAIRSAVGEAIERYSASLPAPGRIVWAKPDDLDGDVLHPQSFRLYTDEQYESDGFPYVVFDPAVLHPWVRGRWLGTATGVWVPALLVYLSLTLARENLICQGTSNGLAASTGHDDAARRAVLELVERDAFMAAWMTGAPGTRVAIDDALDPALRDVLDGVAMDGCEVDLLLLPRPACGTVALCIALGDGERSPGVTIGLGADLHAHAAVRQAILELAQTRPHLSHLMRSGTQATPGDATAVHEMLDHAAYYFPVDRASAFARIRASGEAVSLGPLPCREESSLESCARALEPAGVRVAIVDVTSPDVATGPFRVVRAVSPDLQPISYGYGLDRMPVGRIRDRVVAPSRTDIHPIW